jgi:hypothetical protein
VGVCAATQSPDGDTDNEDGLYRGLSPEIAHFRIKSDAMPNDGSMPADWYIKGGPVGKPPPLDARYILRSAYQPAMYDM